MIDLVKIGAALTFFGFLVVGSAVAYLGLAPLPATLEAAQAAARNSAVAQGLGWIIAGLGLSTALFGSAKSDTAVDMKLETLVQRPRAAREESKKQAMFVCSECGGDISGEATICPHCGEPITGD